MKYWLYRTAQGILLCCLAATLPAFAQDNPPQTNDHPAHERQTQKAEHRTQGPAAKPQAGTREQASPRKAERDGNHGQSERENREIGHSQQQYRGNNHAQRQPNRGERNARADHDRPAQWGRAPEHRGSYQFRSNDRDYLHRYYMNQVRAINRASRPVFRAGGYFPYAYIGYLSPLPQELYGELPPPPPGYQMGYYDGYVVVYDPVTFYIAAVIDLLQ